MGTSPAAGAPVSARSPARSRTDARMPSSAGRRRRAAPRFVCCAWTCRRRSGRPASRAGRLILPRWNAAPAPRPARTRTVPVPRKMMEDLQRTLTSNAHHNISQHTAGIVSSCMTFILITGKPLVLRRAEQQCMRTGMCHAIQFISESAARQLVHELLQYFGT